MTSSTPKNKSSDEMDKLKKFVGVRVKKRCPAGHQFVIRQNKDTDEFFFGCSFYPTCRHTDEISFAEWRKLEATLLQQPEEPTKTKARI